MAKAPQFPTSPNPEPAPRPRLHVLRDVVMDFSPAYFAMVMATGIVSLSTQMLGMPRLAVALFRLNVAAYAAIWLLTLVRVLWFHRLVLHDLVDHQRGPGFFTSVAGSCILGSQFILISATYQAATALWILAIALWVLLTYTIFAAFTIKENKPTLYE